MAWLNTLIKHLGDLLRWWVVIAPWEQAVRVRLGKRTKLLEGGIHLRIPKIDLVYKQSIRLRYCSIPTQTLTTRDGIAITTSGMAGFEIADIMRVYQTLHHPDAVVYGRAMSIISETVVNSTREDCTPSRVEMVVKESLQGYIEEMGLRLVDLSITDFAAVKTFRLIQGEPMDWISNDLDTSTSEVE